VRDKYYDVGLIMQRRLNAQLHSADEY